MTLDVTDNHIYFGRRSYLLRAEIEAFGLLPDIH